MDICENMWETSTARYQQGLESTNTAILCAQYTEPEVYGILPPHIKLTDARNVFQLV